MYNIIKHNHNYVDDILSLGLAILRQYMVMFILIIVKGSPYLGVCIDHEAHNLV